MQEQHVWNMSLFWGTGVEFFNSFFPDSNLAFFQSRESIFFDAAIFYLF